MQRPTEVFSLLVKLDFVLSLLQISTSFENVIGTQELFYVREDRCYTLPSALC